jgi:hypothetical protein
MTMSTVLNLEKYKSLFKDDASFRQFAELIENATEGNVMRLVLCGDEILTALISAEEAQERLQDRIAKRLAKDPTTLDKLKERLESDDIVP